MTPLLFLSRHAPTDSQRALTAQLGFSELRHVDVQFEGDPVLRLAALGVPPSGAVALVAPLYVGLRLLRAGYSVIEFVNDPASRRLDTFSCIGAYRHTLTASQFTAVSR